jgi:RNA polymerase sigma factor (sigma-70 family)
MSSSEVSEEALSRLIESRTNFLRFLRNRVSSPEIAEDILQNAFVKSIEKGGEIRDAESIVPWFYRVLRNSVVDYYRQTGRNQQELKGVLADLETYASATPEPRNEICQCINPLLENLKPEYRVALTTIDLGDGSLADLASQAGITEGNAAVRIHRARQAMLKQVQMTCGACAEHHCIDCRCKHPGD